MKNYEWERDWELVFMKERRTLMKREIPQSVPTLFYPGAVYDYGPMWYFVHNFGVRRVFHIEFGLYLDFMPITNEDSYAGSLQTREIPEDILRTYEWPSSTDPKQTPYSLLLKNFPEYRVASSEEVFPSYFGVSSWDYFWDINCPDYQRRPSYGVKIRLTNDTDAIDFYFLKTDAIGTYDLLLALGWNIDVMVVHEHGFGGGWTGFAGNSRLYRIAKRHKKMPRYLFVAEDQELWPGYRQVEDAVLILGRGQFFQQKRAVCMLSSKEGPTTHLERVTEYLEKP
ncbi:MAG TPA: hypothetical protein P5519_01905 [Spirochaetia bacterium]|nr:hypothetical protein [Spirochaetales bacterium]HRS64628.1 hypothetical protein [Spirochaetia bacterium]HOT58045.1 hypothetical protein [Spirochaetales bacterium]HPD80566.1 hypothetical protein [Spirochaetales bacterium]HQK33755.1 hypothetical protein [Spirochaetales bacterium]